MKYLEEVEFILSSIHQRAHSAERIRSCRTILTGLKKNAINRNCQDEAKHIWCLEQVLEAHLEFQAAFREIKAETFYASWCRLERVEITLHSLYRHFHRNWGDYKLEYLAKPPASNRQGAEVPS